MSIVSPDPQPDKVSHSVTSETIPLKADGSISDWATVPFFDGQSLEDSVALGDEEERFRANVDHHPAREYKTVNSIPLSLHESLYYLIGIHPNLKGMPDVTAYVARLGARVLIGVDALYQLDKNRRAAYESGLELSSQLYVNQKYMGFRNLSQQAVALKPAIYHETLGVVSQIRYITGLSNETVILGCLAAGLAQSVEWVRPEYRDRFALTVLNFCKWLESRVDWTASITGR